MNNPSRQKWDLTLQSSHTNPSFACPTELISRCKDHHLETVAIVDMNTIAGIEEARASAKRHGIRLISGFQTVASQIIFENIIFLPLLVYGFEVNSEVALLVELLQKLSTQDIKDPLSPKNFSSLETILPPIIEAGGMVAIRESRFTRVYWGDYSSNLRTLRRLGIHGVECYSKTFSLQESLRLTNAAKETDMVIVGGSNFNEQTERNNYPGNWNNHQDSTHIPLDPRIELFN